MKRMPLVLLTLALAACGGSDDPGEDEPRDPFFTEAEWAEIRKLSPLPELPPSPTNRYADDAAAARLGQKFFFDKRFSGALAHADNEGPGGNGKVGEAGKVSCASCHDPQDLFIDTRSQPNNVSLGRAWGPRNSPTVLNVAYFDFILWDARADSLWMQAIRPLDLEPEQGLTRLGLAHVVHRHYRSEYNAVFRDFPLPDLSDTTRFPLSGGPAVPEDGTEASASWRQMSEADRDAVNRIAANFGKAIEAYERLLVPGPSKFDRYVAGEHELFAESEKRGLQVFLGVSRCIECHKGPLFSDGELHNLGLAQQQGPHVPAQDLGASAAVGLLLTDPFNGVGPYSDDPAAGRAKLDRLAALDPQPGQFRTASLRNIRLTPPYFHNGSETGLTGVIEFYRIGGDPEGTFVGTRDPKILPILEEDGFTPTQVFDLQEFLWTLTGEPLDASLTSEPELPP